MNLRSPEAFIRIDVPDAPQYALVQQQRLDPRAPFANSVREFLLAHFERIGAESRQLFGKERFSQVGDTPETASVRVAQFAPIVQQHANVSMFFERLSGRSRSDLPGHPEMHKQRRRRRIAIRGNARFFTCRRQPQQHEFAVTLHRFDLPSRQVMLQCGGIVDEIRLTQRDRNDPPSKNRLAQSSRYCFDFRKFRHKKSDSSK